MVHPALQPLMDPEHAKLIRTSSGLKLSVGFFVRAPHCLIRTGPLHLQLLTSTPPLPILHRLLNISRLCCASSDSRPPYVLLSHARNFLPPLSSLFT